KRKSGKMEGGERASERDREIERDPQPVHLLRVLVLDEELRERLDVRPLVCPCLKGFPGEGSEEEGAEEKGKSDAGDGERRRERRREEPKMEQGWRTRR